MAFFEKRYATIMLAMLQLHNSIPADAIKPVDARKAT